MKKLLLLVVLVASVVFYVGCKCCDEEPQTKPNENCKPPENIPDIDIEIQDITPYKYVCVEEQGNYEKIEQVINTLWAEAGKQQIKPMGGMFGVYYNDPNAASMEEWKWEMGFKVMGDVNVKAPLVLKEWNYNKIATVTKVGNPDETEGKMYPALEKAIYKQGYTIVGPAMSFYLSGPNTKPEDMKVMMTFPVTKEEADK